MHVSVSKTSLKSAIAALRAAKVPLDTPVVVSAQADGTALQYCDPALTVSQELQRTHKDITPGNGVFALRFLKRAADSGGSSVMLCVENGTCATRNNHKGRYQEEPQPTQEIAGTLRPVSKPDPVAIPDLLQVLRVQAFEFDDEYDSRPALCGTVVKLYAQPDTNVKRPVSVASNGFSLCYGGKNGYVI
jgi:hypothetical protein